MKLYINPFLDVFYEWGRKQGYWETKREVVVFLNGRLTRDFPKLEKLAAYDEEMGGSCVPIAPIREYLEDNVPEWYYRKGWSMNIGGNIAEVIDAWERNSSMNFTGRNPSNLTLRETKGYPKELMGRGESPLDLYVGGTYVQLLNLRNISHSAVIFLNSLYFTTVKGQSWCNVSSPSRFINWTEDPFEEVKG